MNVNIEEVTSKVAVVEGESLLTAEQIQKLIESVLKHIQENQRRPELRAGLMLDLGKSHKVGRDIVETITVRVRAGKSRRKRTPSK